MGQKRLTAVHTVNSEALTTFAAALSDNGSKIVGREDQHRYELFLKLKGIEQKHTKIKRPQSNDIVERQHCTLLDEHFCVEGQRDQDLIVHNTKPHQGRGMKGRTPLQTFRAGVPNQPEVTPKPDTSPLPDKPSREGDCQTIPVRLYQIPVTRTHRDLVRRRLPPRRTCGVAEPPDGGAGD